MRINKRKMKETHRDIYLPIGQRSTEAFELTNTTENFDNIKERNEEKEQL